MIIVSLDRSSSVSTPGRSKLSVPEGFPLGSRQTIFCSVSLRVIGELPKRLHGADSSNGPARGQIGWFEVQKTSPFGLEPSPVSRGHR